MTMDIEDLPEETNNFREASIENVHHRFKVVTNKNRCRTDNVTSELPEKYHVFVQTWGCAHNTSDSEYMAGILARYGYQVTLGGSTQLDLSPSTTPLDQSTTKCNCNSDLSNGDAPDHQSICACQTDTVDAKTAASCRDSSRLDSDASARENADLWLLNSCTVKDPAEDHFRNAVQTGVKIGKRIVVAGCVPQGRPGADYLKNISVIGVQQIDRVVEVVEETLRGNTVRFLDKKWAPPQGSEQEKGESRPGGRLAGAALDLPKIRRNPLIEILAISTGCLNACTYCKTKHARGVLVSYPIEQLLQRAKQAFDDGVKEMWLTSEDLGAYGRDLERRDAAMACPSVAARFPTCLTLVDLLAGLVRLIPPGCMLRLGMTNPPYILQQLPEIVQVLSHPRVYAFLHIPVQSGSDPVLDVMRREYTVDDFSHVVDYLRSNVLPASTPPSGDIPETSKPGCGSLTIATDIICGFPNETEADFQATVDLVDRYRFPVLYINQFFARSGTPAAKMPRRATTAEVKQRTRRLHQLFHSYQPYSDRVGAHVRVLITEASSDRRFWVGHTKAYEQVLVTKEPAILGRIVLVRITECDKFYMRSELLDRGPFDSLLSEESPSAHDLDRLLPVETQRGSASEPAGLLGALSSPCLEAGAASRFTADGWKRAGDSQWLLKSVVCLVVCYLAAKLCEFNGYLK